MVEGTISGVREFGVTVRLSDGAVAFCIKHQLGYGVRERLYYV